MPEDAERMVLLSEVNELLEGVGGEENMTYEQRLALQHSQQHVLVKTASGKRMVEELKSIERVTDALAVKIVDMRPEHPDDVRAIFARERFLLTPEEIEKIIKIVSSQK